MRTKGAERGAISIGRRAQSYPADAAAIERRKHVPGGRHGAVNPAWNFSPVSGARIARDEIFEAAIPRAVRAPRSVMSAQRMPTLISTDEF
jgi:hypothetical protein